MNRRELISLLAALPIANRLFRKPAYKSMIEYGHDEFGGREVRLTTYKDTPPKPEPGFHVIESVQYESREEAAKLFRQWGKDTERKWREKSNRRLFRKTENE